MLPMPWGAKRMRSECANRARHAERQQDAHPAGHDRRHAMAIELLVIELHPDQKEEQHQADRGKRLERAERTGRKERGGEVRGKAPENRRSNDDSADDLADHARLADFERQPAAGNCDQ